MYEGYFLADKCRFSRIALAILAMSDRVTMLGISRWTADGGSYRTIQRFFTTVIPWAPLFWLFFRTHLFQRDEVYLNVIVIVKTYLTTQTHAHVILFSSDTALPFATLIDYHSLPSNWSSTSTDRRSFCLVMQRAVDGSREVVMP